MEVKKTPPAASKEGEAPAYPAGTPPPPSVIENAPGDPIEEVPPYKPDGEVAIGASDSGDKPPSIEQNEPETVPPAAPPTKSERPKYGG